MENHDPRFQELVREGDLLVGGFNFGTGSSREQAATALKYRGISLVLAGSFSETYKRNALNNGFLVLEAPDLVNWLRERFPQADPTQRTGLFARLDLRHARLIVEDREFPLPRVGRAAQELIAAGGLENWVRARLEKSVS
jgi:homoaconitate hydratase